MSDSSLRATARILGDACRILEGTTDVLHESIQDVPRLQKVLHIQKVFGILPVSDLQTAQESVHTEIHPQLKLLAERAEKKIARLRRRRTGLQSQVQLQQVRLKAAETASPKRHERGFSRPDPSPSSNEAALARLRFLRNKSDRLSYSLSRRKLQNTTAKLRLGPSLPPPK